MPCSRDSPCPSGCGEIARCISSISPAWQVLADGLNAAADPHVLAIGGLARKAQRLVNAAIHEMEHRAAGHRQWSASVMREHEDRHVVGRVVAPPAPPAVVGPGTTHWPEHVAAHDPCADVVEAAAGEPVVVVVLDLAVSSDEPAERLGLDEPFVQRLAVDTQGLRFALVASGAESVDGHRERGYAYFHDSSFPCSNTRFTSLARRRAPACPARVAAKHQETIRQREGHRGRHCLR